MSGEIGRSAILRLQEACGRGEGGAAAWLEETRQRIASLDQSGPKLNAVLEWNPEAEAIAGAPRLAVPSSARRRPPGSWGSSPRWAG